MRKGLEVKNYASALLDEGFTLKQRAMHFSMMSARRPPSLR